MVLVEYLMLLLFIFCQCVCVCVCVVVTPLFFKFSFKEYSTLSFSQYIESLSQGSVRQLVSFLNWCACYQLDSGQLAMFCTLDFDHHSARQLGMSESKGRQLQSCPLYM